MRIRAGQDELKEQALVRSTGNDGRSAVASLEDLFERPEIEPALLFHAAVAFETVSVEERFDLFLPDAIG
jgi:hypothetical protein